MAELSRYGCRTMTGLNTKKFGHMPTADNRYGMVRSPTVNGYHPQTDGTTEQVNQEIEAYLSIYCASHPEYWPQALHALEFIHNNQRHADRQNTPFELMFGESPVVILLSFEVPNT